MLWFGPTETLTQIQVFSHRELVADAQINYTQANQSVKLANLFQVQFTKCQKTDDVLTIAFQGESRLVTCTGENYFVVPAKTSDLVITGAGYASLNYTVDPAVCTASETLITIPLTAAAQKTLQITDGTSPLQFSGFVAVINGTNITCNATGQCVYAPTQDSTLIQLLYNGVEVFNAQVSQTQTTLLVQKKVLRLSISNCRNNVSISVNGSTPKSATCNTNYWYAAPTADFTIQASQEGYKTEEKQVVISELGGFETPIQF